MALDSMQEIFDKIQAGRKPFWQVVRDTDVEERQVTAEASFEKMHATWRAMVESVDTYRADRRSVSGLVGGDAQRMWDYAAQQETLCGPYLQEVIATALCVAESNACMHRIVAAPTAGAFASSRAAFIFSQFHVRAGSRLTVIVSFAILPTPLLTQCCPSSQGGSGCSFPLRIPAAVPWKHYPQSRSRSWRGLPLRGCRGSSGRTRRHH